MKRNDTASAAKLLSFQNVSQAVAHKEETLRADLSISNVLLWGCFQAVAIKANHIFDAQALMGEEFFIDRSDLEACSITTTPTNPLFSSAEFTPATLPDDEDALFIYHDGLYVREAPIDNGYASDTLLSIEHRFIVNPEEAFFNGLGRWATVAAVDFEKLQPVSLE